jgi:hypothetical protein
MQVQDLQEKLLAHLPLPHSRKRPGKPTPPHLRLPPPAAPPTSA